MILCPHCEKPLGESHDGLGCRRRMSRRFFFGLAVAPLAAGIAAKLPDVPAFRQSDVGRWCSLEDLVRAGAIKGPEFGIFYAVAFCGSYTLTTIRRFPAGTTR